MKNLTRVTRFLIFPMAESKLTLTIWIVSDSVPIEPPYPIEIYSWSQSLPDWWAIPLSIWYGVDTVFHNDNACWYYLCSLTKGCLFLTIKRTRDGNTQVVTPNHLPSDLLPFLPSFQLLSDIYRARAGPTCFATMWGGRTRDPRVWSDNLKIDLAIQLIPFTLDFPTWMRRKVDEMGGPPYQRCGS